MKKLAIVCLAFLLVFCGKKTESTETTATTETSNTPAQTGLADGHYEYLYVFEKDSSFLKLDVKGNNIVGDYRWLPEISDGAVGTIKATQAGNMINGAFIATVEGSESSEKIFIEIKGKNLVWKKYELKEDPKTKELLPDMSKLVAEEVYVFQK